MNIWTKEIVEQLSLAQIVGKSTLSCGKRLGLILVDNAVEFMMIAYVEMEKHLVPRTIRRQKWDDAKNAFEALLDVVGSIEPKLQGHKSETLAFHKVRNSLYHSGKPLTVTGEALDRYLRIAREMHEILFRGHMDASKWEDFLARTGSALFAILGEDAKMPVRTSVVDGHVKVESIAKLPNREILCLIVDHSVRQMGNSPTSTQLDKSLRLSGASHLAGDNLSKRIHDCRKDKLLRKDELSLTSKGQRLISRHFITKD